MRVLQLHASDNARASGGVVAMDRLHRGLKDAGVESRILCGRKTTQSPDVGQIPRSNRLEKNIRKVTSRLGLNDIHAVSAFGVFRQEEFASSDILHIHGIHSNYFSYLALPWLTRRKPTVFTLHDMWALTGHCAFSFGCEHWRTGCGQCPYLDVEPAVQRDSTRIEWKLKDWVYSQSELHIVTPSRWLAELARQSMLKRFHIHHIPHGLDTDAYNALDPDQCRSLLGIPHEKHVLMFVSVKLDDQRKGGNLLLQALQNLPASIKPQTVLLLLGSNGESMARASGIETIDLGYVSHDRIKAVAYSAADLFVFPSRNENSPLVLMESMACGTPMVAFDVGGVEDLVRPGSTGYLARRDDSDDLRDGICQLLEDRSLRLRMRQVCRDTAIQEYRVGIHVQQHIDLYHSLARA